MHDELIKDLMQAAPHINHKVASDWLGNLINIVSRDVRQTASHANQLALQFDIKERCNWYIQRLSGFGGSDIGVLFTEYNGGFYPFDRSARDVVSEKICLSMPTMRTSSTERSTAMRPIIREKFIRKMAAFNLQPYHDAYKALDALRKSGGIANHPWMFSHKGSIYIDKNSEVWLVDFRCPSQQSTVDDIVSEVALYDKAQSAQYKYHLEAAGIKVDHTVVVPFSMEQWDVEVSEFVLQDDFIEAVLMAGDKYWKHVLECELPMAPVSKNFQYAEEMPIDLQKTMAEFVLVKKMMSALTRLDDSNKRKILNQASLCGVNWDLPQMKTRLPAIDISTNSRVLTDYKKICEDFRVTNGNPDDDKYKVETESTTLSVIRSKNGPHVEYIEGIEEIGARAIAFALEDVHVQLSLENKSALAKDPSPPLCKDQRAVDADPGFSLNS